MRIAFIVQRYGTEILGGSEYHCRLIAERMARRADVDVLTTCARDYISWANDYRPGVETVNGVNVLRFENVKVRDIESFNQYSDWIFNHPHSREDEWTWLEQQGPWSPALIEHLRRTHRSYDALIFFTYLYAPTVIGLDIDPARSILVPTAHDEPAARLDIYREMFAKPAAIAFNTDIERAFLTSRFDIRAHTQETVGCGVDLLDAGTPARHPVPGFLPASPFLLYGGRIDRGKGCDGLIEYFTSYKEEGGEAVLVLMGAKLMPLPDVPWLQFAGMLSERDRIAALSVATIVVVPSPLESLSLLALEGMAVGTPVLCNAHADVLVDHCRRSNAGLFYDGRDEFVECTRLLIADQRLRERMGMNGRDYVSANYRWDVIMSKYDKLIAAVASVPSSRFAQ